MCTCSGFGQSALRRGNGPAWAAGAGPDLADGLLIDIDATITIAHSEKTNSAKTWKNSLH